MWSLLMKFIFISLILIKKLALIEKIKEHKSDNQNNNSIEEASKN